MTPAFSDDDVDKRVETADGDPIGVVAMTEADTAYVDLESDAADSIKAVLDWEGNADEVVPIDAGDVRDVGPEAIRLEREVSPGPGRASDSAGTDPVIERDESTVHEDTGDEQRGMGGQSGEGSAAGDAAAAEGEGRSGESLEPETEAMQESGAERHPDEEDRPPHGERTVTEERGEEEDR